MVNQSDTVFFGARRVEAERKEGMVRSVFDSVASRYDAMNDLMSVGAHRLWKQAMIEKLQPRGDMLLLDVAGGTGDIAFRFLEKGGRHAIICDINEAMLREGRDRAINRNLFPGIRWAVGNAQALPFQSDQMDAYTIAFGIRNVTHPEKALSEAHRVLKPGSQFLCLEFSMPENPLLAKAYDAYSYAIIPRMGQMVAGSREPYDYLVESIRTFAAPKQFVTMMGQAGFKQCHARSMALGAVTLYTGWKV